MRRMVLRSLLLTLTATVRGPSPSAAGEALDPALAREIRAQYDELRGHLLNRRWFDRVADQTYRRDALIWKTDRDPLDVVLRRTAALLAHLEQMPGAPDLSPLAGRFEALRSEVARAGFGNPGARYRQFEQACLLRRQIALANPLLDFDAILFLKRHFCPGQEGLGNHMCDQYFGFHAVRGGGLYVLGGAFGPRPVERDVLAGAVCRNGRFRGRALIPGGFLSPDLSYDAKAIVFAYTEGEPTRYRWSEKSTFHLFKVGLGLPGPSGRGRAGGPELVQLTDGAVNDFDPCWMPDGRIVFISERRGGFGRCHGRPVPTWTLHAMDPDTPLGEAGGGITCISFHETNEWHPSINNDGMIVYTRWDYVDRGHSQAHHPWITTPDGRDARAIHGNYPQDARRRPFMEVDVRAIPGSRKYVATAVAHHGQAYGSLILIDPDVEDDDAMAPVRRITPETPFPESESGRAAEAYATAWPLGEDFYLCVHDRDGTARRGTANNYGLYLVDAFGNKELIHRDPKISCLSPIPLRLRTPPPVLPPATAAGRRAAAGQRSAESDPATVVLINVYDGRLPWPEGTRIAALRIIQVLPKSTPRANQPRIGYGSQKNARAVLGTVPVEPDGSAHFRLPPGKPVYFQALDGEGLAVQSMRSDVYVHPGERLVCQGCHERRHRAPAPPGQVPLALRRPPSEIRPDGDGSNPFSYPRLVQPVLDRHCVACHRRYTRAPDLSGVPAQGGWFRSYHSLNRYAFFFTREALTTSRTVPGEFGARASRLLGVLRGSHRDRLKLPAADLHRITLWLDCNSDFYGAYENTEAQARGEVVRPSVE